MDYELSPEMEALLLSLFPAGTQVVETQSYRPDYLTYPVRVRLQTLHDGFRHCVIKIGRREPIAREVQALRIVACLGLPVPEVLAEPVPLLSEEERAEERAMVVLSALPGRSLPWCGTTSLAEADLACRLTIEGVACLHRLTDRVRQLDAVAAFPQHTLPAELAATAAQAGEWMRVDLFRHAVEVVGGALAEAASPLVFSNGDYNPLNFLCEGQALCGFVDFEGACFEDPHIGFAKFLIWSPDDYGWGTGKKAGLVERYLYTRNVSRHAFAPSLVLRCLRHLLQEVSVDDGKDAAAREHMLQIVAEGVQTIEKG
jgi:aminoglycoside phosphotransferase